MLRRAHSGWHAGPRPALQACAAGRVRSAGPGRDVINHGPVGLRHEILQCDVTKTSCHHPSSVLINEKLMHACADRKGPYSKDINDFFARRNIDGKFVGRVTQLEIGPAA